MKNLDNVSVPEMTFYTRKGDEWDNFSSEKIFKGKKVVIFSLPGAFTPTCTSSHLPRYEELYEEFKKKGIDEVYCLSVNDSFVMNAWADFLGIKKVKMLPDGNGDFTRALDMMVDKKDLGFGERSWRYSIYVEDGVIKKHFCEEEKPGDPFEVSDADTMMKYLDPQFGERQRAFLFAKTGCSFCSRAKEILKSKGISYKEILDPGLDALMAVSQKQSYPQIFIDGEYIGGTEELEKKLRLS